MQYFGKKSFSSFLYVLIEIAWYLGFAAIAACGVVFGLVALNDPASVMAYLKGTQVDGYVLGFRSWGLEVRMPLSVMANPTPLLSMMAMVAVRLCVIQAIVFQLKRILAGLRDGQLFREEDARRVRTIGIVVLVGIVANGLTSLLAGIAAGKGIHIEGASLRAIGGIDLVEVLAGLVILVLGELLAQAAAMRADQELIV
jgi:hypothetical protein